MLKLSDKIKVLDSFWLHIIAMLLMLCDHLWATVIPGNQWLNNIGRLAFPIFAFMIVEGYFHTKDLKKYMGRLLIAALLSEIPFNLMYSGEIIYPFHQNVIWTFLLSLVVIYLIEKVKLKEKLWLTIVTSLVLIILASLIALIACLDYYHFGFLTVLAFYIFRGNSWFHCLGQLVSMYIIHVSLFAGMIISLWIFGKEIEIPQQGLAILALIPIWLYNGKRGCNNRGTKMIFYGFYPVHMLFLFIIASCK